MNFLSQFKKGSLRFKIYDMDERKDAFPQSTKHYSSTKNTIKSKKIIDQFYDLYICSKFWIFSRNAAFLYILELQFEFQGQKYSSYSEAYNFTKGVTPPGVLFTFFKLYKLYLIAQSVSYIDYLLV